MSRYTCARPPPPCVLPTPHLLCPSLTPDVSFAFLYYGITQIRGHASDRRAEGKRDRRWGGWDKRRKGKDKCYREGTRTKDSEREELLMHGVAGGGSRIRERASERASGNKGKIEGETRVRPVGGSTGVNTSWRRTCVRFVERGGVAKVGNAGMRRRRRRRRGQAEAGSKGEATLGAGYSYLSDDVILARWF